MDDILPAQISVLQLDESRVAGVLVRVDALVRLLVVEELLEESLHLQDRDPGGAANKQELVDLVLPEARVIECLLHRAESLLEEISTELLEACAGEGLREVDTIGERLDVDALGG